MRASLQPQPYLECRPTGVHRRRHLPRYISQNTVELERSLLFRFACISPPKRSP